ncbi:MAG: hypothetical protein O3C49_04125 [Proteobacteria bacterium]|nr:hypothetical protein [Pseudomonadota bacterium]
MNEALQRDTVIDLLNKLGSEQDDDVLAAARDLHAQITNAGLNWQDLLVGDETAAPIEPAKVESIDDTEDEEDTPEPATRFTGDESETPVLIDKLLAREGNSAEFRAELEEYKTDLAKGNFEPSDHRYIQALSARLSKSR